MAEGASDKADDKKEEIPVEEAAEEGSEKVAEKDTKETKEDADTTNDGVKILEEVFGKTNAAESTGEDTPSVSSGDENSLPKAEPKEEEK